MATDKLVIAYETPDGETRQAEYDSPPSFYNDKDYIVYAKGVLADREEPFKRIVEVYVQSVKYSAYDEGMKALAEDA